MKSSIESINSVQKRVKINIPSNLVEIEFNNAFKRVQQKANLQGFRPGKAPLQMIKKLYGDSVIGEVSERLIRSHLFDVLDQNKVNPIATPVVEDMQGPKLGEEFSFSAVVDVMPEFQVDGYKGLELSCERYSVGDDSVQKEIDFLRRRQAKTKETAEETPAAAGHLVTIGHKVYHNDALVERMDVESFDIALGFNEIYPSLEKEIIGMKAGETKEAMIDLPTDFNEPSLAGQPVKFVITLTSVKDLVMPNFDDEFAKDVEYDSAEALKKEITEQLGRRADSTRRQKLEGQIMTELRKRNDFEVPPSMVDQVIDSMIYELNVPDQNEKKKLLKNDELRKAFREEAKTKAKNTLILWRIAQAEKIEVTDEDVKEHVRSQIPGIDTWEDRKVEDLIRSARSRVKDNLAFEKALRFVESSAKIQDIPTTI
jgi:trigger factor